MSGSTAVTPRLGRIVHYTLTDSDARTIIARRNNAGTANASGNDPREGDTYPALIVRDWATDRAQREVNARNYAKNVAIALERGTGDYDAAQDHYELALAAELELVERASVNLQVFLDGNDVFWATSRSEFDPTTHGQHVQVVNGIDQDLAFPVIERDKLEDDIIFRADPKGHWSDTPVAW